MNAFQKNLTCKQDCHSMTSVRFTAVRLPLHTFCVCTKGYWEAFGHHSSYCLSCQHTRHAVCIQRHVQISEFESAFQCVEMCFTTDGKTFSESQKVSKLPLSNVKLLLGLRKVIVKGWAPHKVRMVLPAVGLDACLCYTVTRDLSQGGVPFE